jgi:hypothetical protein
MLLKVTTIVIHTIFQFFLFIVVACFTLAFFGSLHAEIVGYFKSAANFFLPAEWNAMKEKK